MDKELIVKTTIGVLIGVIVVVCIFIGAAFIATSFNALAAVIISFIGGIIAGATVQEFKEMIRNGF